MTVSVEIEFPDPQCPGVLDRVKSEYIRLRVHLFAGLITKEFFEKEKERIFKKSRDFFKDSLQVTVKDD